jgi:hypothetical protein
MSDIIYECASMFNMVDRTISVNAVKSSNYLINQIEFQVTNKTVKKLLE